MCPASPRLDLPYLEPAQAQKHVTHNEALLRLDAVVQMVLQSLDLDTPPASPALGAGFGIGAAPSGVWSGHPDEVAIWQGEGWLFLTPSVGWRIWDVAAGMARVWDGTAWIAPDRLDRLGLSTTADDTNRLAVASDAVLFTHAGAGHQVKINKSGSGETASLLFQSNWTGHAELGLAGNTDFSLKVSNGGSWSEAMVVKSASGRIGLGTNSPAARLALAQNGSGDDYLVAGEGSPLFRLAADGSGSCAGAWSGGGADLAEYFEWADGNPEGEDRRGRSVVLVGRQIRLAEPGETPIGVISAAPCLIGNDDLDSWQGRWLRDAFGTVCRDETGARRAAPGYDPNRPYLPRRARTEWTLVGMLGQLVLRPNQPVDPRWLYMAPAPEGLEHWLLR